MFIVFTAWNYQVTLIELLAVITSLIGVWLGTTGARITWPWWIISSVLYAILFFQYKLYSSALLQIVFILAAIWGWFGWSSSGAKPGKLSSKNRVLLVIFSIIFWVVLAPMLAKIGAAATWLDSFILVGSIVAQILMVKEKYENWPLWVVIDFVGTIHYARQELWFTSILYFVFTIIAFIGWKKWVTKSNLIK